jgi:hypothetical protein
MVVATLTDEEVAYFRSLAARDIEATGAAMAGGLFPEEAGVKRLRVARSAVKNLTRNAPRTAEQQAAGLDSAGKPERKS